MTPFHRETCVCCRSRWFTSFWRNTGRVAVDITVRLQLLIILSNSPKILYLSCSFSADVLECLSITNRPIHSFYFLLIHDWYLVAVARRRHRRPRPRPRKWCIMQHAVSCYAPHRYIGLTSIKPELMFIFLAKNLKEVFGILCRRSFVYVSGRLYVFRIKVLLLATANSRILTYVVLLSVVWYVTKILVIFLQQRIKTDDDDDVTTHGRLILRLPTIAANCEFIFRSSVMLLSWLKSCKLYSAVSPHPHVFDLWSLRPAEADFICLCHILINCVIGMVRLNNALDKRVKQHL